MVLARILDPSDFGLVAMVTTLTGMLSLFRDFGLSTATIQRQSISDEQLSTLFWVNVLIGALLSALTLASAHLIANFYREPRLVWITTALAASFLFNAAGIQHSALLAREMRFATLAAIEVIALAMSVDAGSVSRTPASGIGLRSGAHCTLGVQRVCMDMRSMDSRPAATASRRWIADKNG